LGIQVVSKNISSDENDNKPKGILVNIFGLKTNKIERPQNEGINTEMIGKLKMENSIEKETS
jgi:hypothetical protein